MSVEGLRVLCGVAVRYSRVVSAGKLLRSLTHDSSLLSPNLTHSRDLICRVSVRAGGWVAGVGEVCESETFCVAGGRSLRERHLRAYKLEIFLPAQIKKEKERKNSRLSRLSGDA